jgi:hypothetical protein
LFALVIPVTVVPLFGEESCRSFTDSRGGVR